MLKTVQCTAQYFCGNFFLQDSLILYVSLQKKKSTDPKLLNGSVLFICVMWKLLTQAFQFTIGVYESSESSAFLEMGVIRHLVRAVDFGSMLKQQLNDLCMASSCRPYDGVNTVLLGQTNQLHTAENTQTLRWNLIQGHISTHTSNRVSNVQ